MRCFFLLLRSSDGHLDFVIVKVDSDDSVVALGRADVVLALGAGLATVAGRTLGQLVLW